MKGKEKATVGEIYDVFDSIASELWPEAPEKKGDGNDDSDDEGDTGLSLEDQISQELKAMKKPRSQQRFANCQTDTPCVVFISCKTPVDPVQLVMKYVNNVQETGSSQTRHVHRLLPVSDTCYAGIPEMKVLCQKVFEDFFRKEEPERKFKFKIELRIRNHTTLTRQTIIQHVASWVPEGHTVSLGEPDIFILVEVFKSVCGVSIVRDYYKFSKFNVVELANAKKKRDVEAGVDGVSRT